MALLHRCLRHVTQLTLFALLTGLAAIGAPVQARVHDVPGIGMVAAAELTTRCGKQAIARLDDRKQPAAGCRQEQKKGPQAGAVDRLLPAGHVAGRPRARIARSISVQTDRCRTTCGAPIYQICTGTRP